MSFVTQKVLSDPISQLRHLYSSLNGLWSTFCEKTDLAFRRVYVMKKDGNGNIKCYDVKDKEAGGKRKVWILSYAEDIKTGQMQLDEPSHVIAAKCALLTLGFPLYAMGRMAWHAFKTLFEITVLTNKIFIKTSGQFTLGRYYEGALEMRRGFFQISNVFDAGLSEIILAPIFGLGAELASIYGVFKPYQGRKIVAVIENIWQHGVSYKEDFHKILPHEGKNCWEALVEDVRETRPFYLANCFQVRANIHDANILVIRREALVT